MKKLTLLLLGGILATGAQAQHSLLKTVALTNGSELQKKIVRSSSNASANNSVAMRGTATPFVTEDFGSGTRTTLPTGWSASITGASSAATWHWTNAAASGTYNIGALNSTTAANGWMIFDSDSIGSLTGSTVPLNGYLTSPAYNCTGHAAVVASFQQDFVRFNDSCFLEVSTNNFTTFTKYSITPNNTIAFNSDLGANPHIARINISSAAGNQANVKVRFHYMGLEAGGSYNWTLDDFSLADLDAVDLGISTSGFLMVHPVQDYAPLSAYSNLPVSLADSVFPFTVLANAGAANQTGVTVNAKLFKGTTQVYNQTAAYGSIPTGGADSLVEFTNAPGYLPGVGSYVGAFSVSQAGDAIASNNVDTFRFNVTDTIYSVYGKSLASAYYLHRPSTHSAGEASFFSGSRFDIPTGKSDTVSSISASFGTGSTAGTIVTGQIYKLDISAGGWGLVGETIQKAVPASEISTSAGVRYSTFRMNNFLIMDEGSYAVVFSTVNAAPTSTFTINSSTPLYDAPGLVGYYGQGSTAGNLGAADFAVNDGIATGSTPPRLITLNFGRYSAVGIKNIPGATIGKVFPNPANNTVSIPVTMKETASVNITLSNTVGQVLATQNLGQLSANQTKNATFNTASIANGIYLLTVEANGARTTSRFVVAH